MTWISSNDRWVGAIYGTNLTDEDYFVGGTALLESSGVGGRAFNAPRMYGRGDQVQLLAEATQQTHQRILHPEDAWSK